MLREFISENKTFLKIFFVFMVFYIPSAMIFDLWWDSAVYLLNAKQFFGGSSFYFDPFLHPMLPMIIAGFWKIFGQSEIVARSINILFTGAAVLSTYLLGKEIFNKQVAVFSSLFLIVNPIFLDFSTRINTDIPFAFLSTFVIYLLYTGLERRRPKNLFFSTLLIGFAVTIKSPALVLFPITFIFILARQREKIFDPLIWSGYILSAVFILLVSTFLGRGINSYVNSFPNFSEILNPDYLLESPLVFTTSLPLVILAIKNKKLQLITSKKYLPLILTLFFIVGFFQTLPKEKRYLIAAMPPFFIIASKELDELVRKKIPEGFGKLSPGFGRIFLIYFLISLLVAIGFVYDQEVFLRPQAIIDASKYIQSHDQNGAIISNVWPQTAYYSSEPAKWYPWNEQNLKVQLQTYRINYLVFVQWKNGEKTAPGWIYNGSLDRIDFLKKEVTFDDNQETATIYSYANQTQGRISIIQVTTIGKYGD